MNKTGMNLRRMPYSWTKRRLHRNSRRSKKYTNSMLKLNNNPQGKNYKLKTRPSPKQFHISPQHICIRCTLTCERAFFNQILFLGSTYPLHCDDNEADWYVPAEQLVQTVAAIEAYVPAEQLPEQYVTALTDE